MDASTTITGVDFSNAGDLNDLVASLVFEWDEEDVEMVIVLLITSISPACLLRPVHWRWLLCRLQQCCHTDVVKWHVL